MALPNQHKQCNWNPKSPTVHDHRMVCAIDAMSNGRKTHFLAHELLEKRTIRNNHRNRNENCWNSVEFTFYVEIFDVLICAAWVLKHDFSAFQYEATLRPTSWHFANGKPCPAAAVQVAIAVEWCTGAFITTLHSLHFWHNGNVCDDRQ